MCGIAGMIRMASQEPISQPLLKAMSDTLAHRGPDDEGFHVSSGVGLAHRRLSIIDRAGGHQPLYNEDGSIAIVFNGEIYNFKDLRKELVQKGYRFRTVSDTEVIVHAYEEFGDSCIERLRGMFAFALWDRRKNRALLGRDRVGKKPLYYAVINGTLYFASEIKALLQVSVIPREIDLEALSDYLTFLYIPSPKSIFRSIRKLRPAHYLSVEKQAVSEHEYWDLHFDVGSGKAEEGYEEQLESLLKEAVNIRLESEVPLGAFLSGGIDSSAVVALMAEQLNRRVTTASVGFLSDQYNELEFAQLVSSRYKTDAYEEVVTPRAIEILDKLIWHFDEPFADDSAIPTYYVSQIAKRKVTVALSGDGGDENFAGYRRYFFDRLENRIRNALPSSFRKLVIRPVAMIYPKGDWLPQPLRAKTLLSNLTCAPEEAYYRTMAAFQDQMKEQLLLPEVRNKLSGYWSYDLFDYYLSRAGTSDPLSRIQYLDVKTYLTDDILAKVDRASMAHSLEVRAPLLDHRVMELAAKMPSNLKLRGRQGKFIFKKVMAKYLPPDILYRRKMGFSVPVAEWFRSDLKRLTEEMLLGSTFESGAYLNQEFIRYLWEKHQSGRWNFSKQLWAILVLEFWMRRFLHQPVQEVE